MPEQQSSTAEATASQQTAQAIGKIPQTVADRPATDLQGSTNDNKGVQELDGETKAFRPQTQKKTRAPRCRFFGTRKGCRAGASCPFRHDISSVLVQDQVTPSTPNDAETAEPSTVGMVNSSKPLTATARRPVTADPSRIVQRPTAPAEKQDPHSFQINQIKRRFSPKEETSPNGDLLLHFGMPPSDPDFPFDIDNLECTLRVPQGFLGPGRPTLRVTNEVMERGYQINIEQGFDGIWSQSAAPTLLNTMKALDKRLEELLTAQKAEIFKIVPNAGPKAVPVSTDVKLVLLQESRPAPRPPQQVLEIQSAPKAAFVSLQRREQARKRREEEVQILEHRLGRHPQFSKAADSTLFTVPVEARRKSDLPVQLQAVKLIRLFVPSDYGIEPCNVELLGVEGNAATAVEKAFEKRARDAPEATLLAQVNYLASNMHVMAKEDVVEPEPKPISPAVGEPGIAEQGLQEEEQAEASHDEDIRDTDKDHVKMISRPPEWDAAPSGDSDESDGYDSDYTGSSGDDDDGDESENEDDEGKEEGNASSSEQQTSTSLLEKGILFSFPGLELHGIELLELTVLNLTVKCERCKDMMDVPRLQPSVSSLTLGTTSATSNPTSKEISTRCKKCALPYSLTFRADIIHAHSPRAGYLDLIGCTPHDLLPSSFTPTCSNCSTPTTTGITAVRGASSLAICRTCHAHMSFHIPAVRFLRISSAATSSLPLRQPRGSGARKPERLGLTPGTPLPQRGTCAHYKRSHRWFRFGCCGRVYACDVCHDAAAETDHPHELATRMLCGFCSREQVYRPYSCGMQGCRRELVGGGSKGGFWEGGKGTRDTNKMSRKDPRKYKRRGGTRVGPSAKTKAKAKK